MKAILKDSYGSPDVLILAEVDKPEPVGDQVLVRVEAASLNTADLDILRGFPRAVRVGVGWRAPKYHGVGLDVAGRVEAVGPDVTGF
ncbi:MAG TPA: alcohol dehydrogenase catalytic domain-containing protein, partial [Acidimicrobiia bacterium]|nr:alcohol dehydrogenase catalytic domain-containing protein [Acidimicrobiia bacterium]